MSTIDTTPQNTISEKLRSDINQILAKIPDTKGRAKAACATAFFHHGIIPKTGFVQTLISTPGHMANQQTVKAGVQEFWGELRGRFNTPLPRADLPEDLHEKLTEFAVLFWQKASERGIDLARDELDAQRHSYVELSVKAKQEVAESRHREANLSDQLSKANGELAALREEVGLLREDQSEKSTQISHLMQANGVLTQQLAQSSATIDQLTSDADHSIGELEKRLTAEIQEKALLRDSCQREIKFMTDHAKLAVESEAVNREKMAKLDEKVEALQAANKAIERENVVIQLKNESYMASEEAHRAKSERLAEKLKVSDLSLLQSRTEISAKEELIQSMKGSVIALVDQVAHHECPSFVALSELTGAQLFSKVEADGSVVIWCETAGVEIVAKSRGLRAFERAAAAALIAVKKKTGAD